MHTSTPLEVTLAGVIAVLGNAVLLARKILFSIVIGGGILSVWFSERLIEMVSREEVVGHGMAVQT